jgi:hypothetical protein
MASNLVCFLSSQYDKLDRKNLISTLSEFYTLEEITESKQILIAECEKTAVAPSIVAYKTKRQFTSKNAKSNSMKDVVDIWQVIDHELTGDLPVIFVAGNPNRPSSVNADKFNLKFLISMILNLKKNRLRLNNKS